MQRGKDPEGLPLVAFGGAGGLHAAALAQSLRMRAALVPLHPGALSARGMTAADAIRDHASTTLAPLERFPTRERRARQRELSRLGHAELVSVGFAPADVVFEHALDLRYRGQSFELRVPEGPDPAEAFQRAHERLYGYRLNGREIELVCLRTRALVPAARGRTTTVRARKLPAGLVRARRRVVFDRAHATPLLHRADLAPGHRVEGPALIEEYSGTTLVPPGFRATVVAGGHLVLESGTRAR
jgi:N-methylhydantoinase A